MAAAVANGLCDNCILICKKVFGAIDHGLQHKDPETERLLCSCPLLWKLNGSVIARMCSPHWWSSDVTRAKSNRRRVYAPILPEVCLQRAGWDFLALIAIHRIHNICKAVFWYIRGYFLELCDNRNAHERCYSYAVNKIWSVYYTKEKLPAILQIEKLNTTRADYVVWKVLLVRRVGANARVKRLNYSIIHASLESTNQRKHDFAFTDFRSVFFFV
jgi:hypothetical protein